MTMTNIRSITILVAFRRCSLHNSGVASSVIGDSIRAVVHCVDNSRAIEGRCCISWWYSRSARKARSTLNSVEATLSKQRSTLSKPKGLNFNAKLVRRCCRFWQQSRTLLRHCCQERQQCRSNIRQCCFDNVAGVDRA